MTATNPVELRIKRQLMLKYLKLDHVMLTLYRPMIETTPAGGKKRGAPQTLEPQMFRFYPFVRRMTQITRDTPDGDIINLRYVIVGLYTADVQAADYFEYDGGVYDVVSIDPMHQDRKAANVTYRGKASNEPWG